MQIYANMHLPHHFTTIAYICKKYAKNMHMHDMHLHFADGGLRPYWPDYCPASDSKRHDGQWT